MATVLEGYMAGEAVKRQRYEAERTYGHEREVFAENTRRFDVTFEEGVRQFDTDLVFRAEQSALERDHQFDLQDDSQEFMSEESQLERTFRHDETSLERDSRETHQQKERAKEYHRIKKNVEMQNEDRALRSETNEIARAKKFLGSSPTYNSMPDEYIIGRDKKPYAFDDPALDITTELISIIDAEGSNVLNVSPEQAAVYLEMIQNSDR